MKGGLLAACIAGPVISVGSATFFPGPVIRVSDIYSETAYTVLIISLSIIGAFRAWSVKLFTDYIEGVVLFVVMLKLSDLVGVSIDTYKDGTTGGQGHVATITTEIMNFVENVPALVDKWNDALFNCGPSKWKCAIGIGVGALLYPGIVGLFLSVVVGFDAASTQPQGAYPGDRKLKPPTAGVSGRPRAAADADATRANGGRHNAGSHGMLRWIGRCLARSNSQGPAAVEPGAAATATTIPPRE